MAKRAIKLKQIKFDWHGHSFDTSRIKASTLKVTQWMIKFYHGESDWDIPAGEVDESVFEFLLKSYKEMIV